MKCKNKNVRNRKSNIILPTRQQDCEKRSIAINRKMRLRD